MFVDETVKDCVCPFSTEFKIKTIEEIKFIFVEWRLIFYVFLFLNPLRGSWKYFIKLEYLVKAPFVLTIIIFDWSNDL